MTEEQNITIDRSFIKPQPAQKNNSTQQLVRSLFADAGIQIDGQRPFDIQVRDSRFYDRVLADGPLGFGEAYMEGWWDCNDIAEMIARVTTQDIEKKLKLSWKLLWGTMRSRLLNLQSRSRSHIVGRDHYDMTLDAYESMTGQWLALSCGYWKSAKTLDEAQEAKFDLICRKLELKNGERVLDIGCGFGSFARFAAERYGCRIVGINISPQQAERARSYCEGLPVKIITCDYRDTDQYLTGGPFDKIVSIGMFEHVGNKNFRTYFQVANQCLKEGGLFLLHTIGSNVSLFQNDPWFEKYIFPGGLLPSIKQIGEAIENLFVMEDWHNFGYDYSLTLNSWFQNFDQSWTGPKNDPFYRMWTYYLLSCAGYFKARRVQLWHVVLSRSGHVGGYTSIR
ncbi:MAG: cyclopropane fatty acyl phospholipid synthase [Gammaproteobacteria bacterium]